MSTAKTNFIASAGFDAAIVDELRSTSSIGVYEDLSPLISFVQKNGLTRSFTNMLYFSASNDLGQLTKTTQQLSIVLDVINYVLGDKSPTTNLSVKLSLIDEASHLNEVYTMVCSNLTIVYKIYGMRKPAVTVAITKVLQCLVEYDNSNIFSQFIDNFDFNHSAVQNILVPTRDDFERKFIDERAMRKAFVDLWICICSASIPTLRKALLTNFKIMNNFWKYMNMERYEVLNKILSFLDKFVCSEPTFKRATKCRILNENFLYNVRSLFLCLKSENDRSEDNDDLHDFNEFKLNFTSFMNTLVSDANKGITYPENDFGSPLVVNSVTFNVNNKLIFTLLTALKPWDSLAQLQLVMQILNHNHELLPPYMHWIVSNSGGYHDPTLSSYWIGHTFLYSEILKSEHLPPKSEFVSLLPLSKNALSECIAFPSDLIKQLSLQLVLLQLQKLSRAKYVSQSTKDYVLSNLPSHAAFLPLITHENNLIKLTATQIVTIQEELAPKSSSSAVVGVISKQLTVLRSSPEKCDSFDLILLDMYLSIQSNNELKWWNKVGKENNSFFTSLLKFSKLPFLRSKILRILQKLTKPTLVFNEVGVVESPIVVLIEAMASVEDDISLNSIWACLDETISRAVGSPYKYLDKSHNLYDDMSIFLIVLLEQINFVPDLQNQKSVLRWLGRLATGMVMIGEPASGLTKAADDANVPITLKLDSLKSRENITSALELAEAVLVLDNAIQANKSTSEIFTQIANMGKFLMSIKLPGTPISKFILSPSKWTFLNRLGAETISESELLAACLYIELLGQLNLDFSDSEIRHFIYTLTSTKLSKRNQALLRKFMWILSDAQLESLSRSKDNELVVLEASKILIMRNVFFIPDLANLMRFDSSEVHQILLHLCPSEEQVDLIIQNPRFFYLLEQGSPEIANSLSRANDLPDSLLYQVGSFYPELGGKYRARIVHLALSMGNWTNSLRLFTQYVSFFDPEKVSNLVFSRSECHTKEAMSSSFVHLVRALVTSQSTISEFINDWLQRAMLYVTRKLSESDLLSETFETFLKSLQNLISYRTDLLTTVPVKILDDQLEAILTSKIWVSRTSITEYANHVILAVNPKVLSSDKLLQLFVNNEKNPLRNLPSASNFEARFQSSLIIYTLFHSNEAASSTVTLLESVLVLYLGSQRADDLLLKYVLQAIEKNVTHSWVSWITNWDYQDEVTPEEIELIGEERLFSKSPSSLAVALNKKFVKNTTKSSLKSVEIPETRDFNDFEKFSLRCPSGTYQETVYDPEFLMLLIINNEELMRESGGTIHFSISKLVDSELLCFIVTCLACDKVREIAKIILMGVLKDLCDSTIPFKDMNIMKVYISSILHTVRVADHSVSLVWYVIGSLCNIIVNPGHIMYDRVHHYILSTPIFKHTDIPLFKSVVSFSNHDDAVDDDDYYKPVNWLVEQMADGLKNLDDLRLLKSRGALEWIFNIFHSNYAPTRLRLNVLKLLYSIQKVGPEGSDMLVTKFAGLSALEVIKRCAPIKHWSGLQEGLNVDQLALRVAMLKSQKRVRDWTFNNVEDALKRVKSA